MSYETVTPPEEYIDEYSVLAEGQQVISDEEHTDTSYVNVFDVDCRRIGGSKEHTTVLENLFDGIALNDFEVLRVSTENKQQRTQQKLVSHQHRGARRTRPCFFFF